MSPSQSPTVVRGLGDPSRYLLPEEIVVVGVRRHPLVLGAAGLETIGFIACALMLQYLFEYTPLVDRLCAVIILIALVRMVYLVIEWRMERFVISNQRMILISGVFNRRVAAVPLRKVTDLTFERPLVGQLLGYGTFIIESAGQDQAMSHVAYLPHANRLYLKVSDLLFGTGLPQVEPDLLVDPEADQITEGQWDREADRLDTDPQLGAKLAGLDLDRPLPADPSPLVTAPSRPYDHEGDWLPSEQHVHIPGLSERPRSVAAERLLSGLGGLHGRGVRRETATDPLRENRPPRWARRG